MHKTSRSEVYIFKIDNVSISQPHSIKIGDVVFYDPQKIRILNVEDFKEEEKGRYIEAEDFHFPRNGQFDESKRSRCNAIIRAKYRSHEDIESHNNFFQAFHKVSDSLNILTKILNRYGDTDYGKPEIDIKNSIKLHGNKKPARFSFDIFRDHYRDVNITNKEVLKYFNKEVGFINKINQGTSVGATLLEIISIHGKFEKSVELFNFLDLWIRWESLFKGNRENFKQLARDCFYIKYQKNYLAYMKGFLYFKIREEYPDFRRGCWILTEKQIRKVGLEVKTHKIIQTKKFKDNFNLIPTYLPIEIVKDIVANADDFVNIPHAARFCA